jgi:hypothetical protein
MFKLTFQEYKNNYKRRLQVFLDDYEDNTPDLFFENELKTYNASHNELKFIVDNFDKKFEEEINEGQSKDLYLSLINGFIESQHKFKPIPKPSIPQSIVNFVFQSILNPKTKTISKVKNIPITQYTKEELNIILKDSWDSSCNEDYIKSNMKKIYNNIITSTKSIIDFINDEKSKLQNSGAPENITNFENDVKEENIKSKVNPHSQVFSGPLAFELFEKLHETHKATKIPLADYSFIYRIMFKDGYILESFRPQMFIRWISKEPYNIELDKIKTISNCTTDSKIQTYNIIKKSLQIN